MKVPAGRGTTPRQQACPQHCCCATSALWSSSPPPRSSLQPMSRIFCLHFLPLRPGFRVPPSCRGRGGSSLQLPPALPAPSCPNRTGPRCASRGRSTPGRSRAPLQGEGTAVGDSRDGLIPGRPDGQMDSRAVPWTQPKSLSHAGDSGPGDAGRCPPLREGRVETPGSAAFLPRLHKGPAQRRAARKSPGIRETALVGSSTMEGFSFATKGLLTGRGRSRGMHRARRPAQGGCGLHFPRPLPQSRGQEQLSGDVQPSEGQAGAPQAPASCLASAGGILGLAGGGPVPGCTERAAAARILGLGAGTQRAQGKKSWRARPHGFQPAVPHPWLTSNRVRG